MELLQVKRLTSPEEDNSRLKTPLVEAMLDKALKEQILNDHSNESTLLTVKIFSQIRLVLNTGLFL